MRLTLRRRFALVLVTVTVGFLVFGAATWSTLEQLRVNGAVYKRIVQGKDLIADVLPPPAYIIESYLVLLQLNGTVDAAERDRLIERLSALHKDFETRQTFWRGERLEGPIKQNLLERSYQPAMEFYRIAREVYLPALRSGDRIATENALVQLRQEYEMHRKAIDAVVELAIKRNSDDEKLADQLIKRNATVLISVFMLSVGLAFTFLVVTSRRIIRQLGSEPEEAVAMAERIAAGDLIAEDTVQQAVHGSLAAAFAGMQSQLRQVIRGIAGGSTQLASAAEELSAATEQSSQTVAQQHAETAQVAASVTELSAAAKEVAESSSRAATAAESANQQASSGLDAVARVRQSIDSLATDVKAASTVIQNLAGESTKISAVMEVIDGVASQTNLLALNAAIEAARAGEQGRGFAVVADEVRTLASRTQASTQEIQQLVAQLQKVAGDAVAVMERSCASAQAGVAQIADAEVILHNITTAVGLITEMTQQIAVAAEEQSAVTQSVNENVVSIDRRSQETAKGAEQMASASAELAKLAEHLHGLVGKFKVA